MNAKTRISPFSSPGLAKVCSHLRREAKLLRVFADGHEGLFSATGNEGRNWSQSSHPRALGVRVDHGHAHDLVIHDRRVSLVRLAEPGGDGEGEMWSDGKQGSYSCDDTRLDVTNFSFPRRYPNRSLRKELLRLRCYVCKSRCTKTTINEVLPACT